MAKTARAAIEDLLTCESCHAFYYVERAEDGARTRLRCTSCGHSRDVLLSGAKTNKWTVIDPNGEVKSFTEWDDLVRGMAGSGVTAVRAKLPSDRPVSDRATSERPPVADRAPSEQPAPAASPVATEARAPSNRPASNRPGSNRPGSNRPGSNRPAVDDVAQFHQVQPIGPSVGPTEIDATSEEVEEKPRSISGASLLDVTPTPMAPALSLDDSAPAMAPAESDKSIDIPMSDPHLPAAPGSKPEALVEALVSAMPEASAPPAATVEKTADVAPVAAKRQEPWDDDEAEVLSMRDIQVVPVTDPSTAETSKPEEEVLSTRDLQVLPATSDAGPSITTMDSNPLIVTSPDIKEREAKNSSTPPPPARGALRTLPPARLGAPPPPTITFEEAKKSDPPPAVAKKGDSSEPAKKAEEKANGKSKKSPEIRVRDMDKDDEDSRTANTVPPKRRTGEAAKSVASAKAQVDKGEEGGRSWLLPALGVAAAAGVVWYLANGSGTPAQNNNPTATPTTTAAPTNTGASTADKPTDPAPTTTTASATPPASASAGPIDKAATTAVKPADSAARPQNTAATGNGEPGDKKPAAAGNLSMSEALDKAGQAKRSGDYAAAKDLYARVLKESAGNVEAHSGLGDIAKAQGDLAAAKSSYQKALASSPDYGPAMLSLADTEWDLGDRAAAQARYAKIVAARGGSAPARAKERAGTE